MSDSAANVPPDLARDLRIRIVPMYLSVGDRVYRDGVDLAPRDVYRLLAGGQAVSTSTPSPADFLEAYEAGGEREVVCVTVAAGMSAANQQARLAAERFAGTVEVVDSLNASMAEGFAAIEAARRAAEGGSLTDVARRAREVAEAARLCATIETFEYLRRSGRVRALQAYAATMLDIRPVFRFAGGEVTPVARPRTRSRALARVAEDALADIGDRPVRLAGIHAAAAADAASVVETVAARARVLERHVTEVTPVVGAHAGPGLVGLAWVCS